MTRQVQEEIEELLKDFGRTGAPEVQIPRPEAREDSANGRSGGEQNRVIGSSGRGKNRVIGSSDHRIIEMQNTTQYLVPSTQQSSTQYLVPSTQRSQEKARRVQRRAWREMMEEAGCRLPFPEEREDVHQVLIYVLGRLVARKMSPPNAEAVVHVCKLMLRI